jgi:hypothetical protein
MRAGWLTLIAITSAATSAHALRDHQQCYRMHDPLGLSGVVDVESPLGVAPGCRLSRARLVCDAATKTVLSANVTVQP